MNYYTHPPIEDVHEILAMCKESRAVNRANDKGYSKDKTMRQSAKIPFGIVNHPEYGKYFDRDMDADSRKKNYDKFFALPEIEFIDETGHLLKCSPKAFLMVDKL